MECEVVSAEHIEVPGTLKVSLASMMAFRLQQPLNPADYPERKRRKKTVRKPHVSRTSGRTKIKHVATRAKQARSRIARRPSAHRRVA